MAEINRAVKGTNDILPSESYRWQFVERKMLETAALYGFKEIRVPVFEHTEVFARNVGDSTDVVQKEMYTFEDKGGRSITLRPELTAGVVRSSVEKGLVNGALPVKVCYIGGCYRYEKPQAGRLREFHQFGIESFGGSAPASDVEVISVARQLLLSLGIENISLEINSIGCPECRKNYHAALKEYFASKKEQLCPTCLERLERNPMRILDCKSPICKEICKSAPVVIDYLCDECHAHFEGVKAHLKAAGIGFKVNPHIVRGLDYYTKTVFEFVAEGIGAQSTVCGGGRYDGLVAQMGGPNIPALGFGMGIERLMLLIDALGVKLPEDKKCELYIAPMGASASLKATELSARLREEGFSVQTDLCGRGLKAQMKYADKIGAKFTIVIGDNELEANKASLKNMTDGTVKEINLNDIFKELFDAINSSALTELCDSIL